MAYKLRPDLDNIKPYAPSEGGFSVRLDANESPFDLPEGLKQALAKAAAELSYNRYPDPSSRALTDAYAGYIGVPQACVAAGNGSDELISLIIQTFLREGESLIVCPPDFSMYGQYAALLGRNIIEVPRDSSGNVDVKKVISKCKEFGAKLVIFSNPCNPTAAQLPAEQVQEIARGTDALVIADEAYAEFSGESAAAAAVSLDNLIVLRTLSKAFSCAALRLGFAISNKKLISVINAARSPYNINSFSQRAGELALGNTQEIMDTVAEVKLLTDSLYCALKDLEIRFPKLLRVAPTHTNFVCIYTQEADGADRFLKSRNICIRAFPEFLRITAGSAQENRLVIKALEEFYENC